MKPLKKTGLKPQPMKLYGDQRKNLLVPSALRTKMKRADQRMRAKGELEDGA